MHARGGKKKKNLFSSYSSSLSVHAERQSEAGWQAFRFKGAKNQPTGLCVGNLTSRHHFRGRLELIPFPMKEPAGSVETANCPGRKTQQNSLPSYHCVLLALA